MENLRRFQEKRLGELLRRCDALDNGYWAVFENDTWAPDGKTETLEVLAELRQEAHERFDSYREEVGIR